MNDRKENWKFFNEEWNNEAPTDKDERGDYYDTDFEDGIDVYIPMKDNQTSIED
jgi:hypothetical protein